MSNFKVGDRIVLTKDRDSAKVGMKGTIVAYSHSYFGVRFDNRFDGGHDLDGKCESGYGHWVLPSEIKLIQQGFEVGQIYRVGKLSFQHEWEDAIIRLTKQQMNGFKTKSIRGEAPLDFMNGSEYARVLTLLTGPQIGEAIRKYDAKHSKSGVREVKRPAKLGEYIKIVDPMHVRGVSREYKIGDILHVKYEVMGSGVACEGITEGICDFEYVVLEGYKPEKEERRKAKVGDTIKALHDNGGPVEAGTIWTVDKIDDFGLNIHNAENPGTYWRIDLDNYIVLSSGKHSYTAVEIAEAKKLCGEMMVETFDDGNTFNVRILDKNYGEKSDAVNCEIARFNGASGATGNAKCSDHDEYNVWIGRCVALCKALHKPIPAFIMGDGKGRHFDFEKARAKGTNSYFTGEKVVTIHCKTESEARQLLGELSKLGYLWSDKTPLLSEINFANGDGHYNAYSSKTVTFNRSTFENVAEFSDCFTED